MNDKELLEQLGVKDTDKNTNDYLKHYGILGMKWGVRRFQPYPKGQGNKGTFLDKKKRQYANAEANKQAYKDKKRSIKKSIEQAPKKAVTQLAKKKIDQYNTHGAKNRAQKEKVREAVKTAIQKKPKVDVKKPDPVKSMSDAELRDRINRIQMERQYSKLTTKEKSKGEKIYNEYIALPTKVAITATVTRVVAGQINSIIKGK